MFTSIAGRAVVVTGGTRGIGKGIASVFARNGAKVLITGRDSDAARAAAMKLCASIGRTVLLHGDFLDKNLLWNGAGYLAIDPIPCIGDPCSDVGFFAAGNPPATTILPRAGTIAARMDLDQHRAREWAAIWTVLQTCQAWRPDQSDLDACMSSDVFERLLHQ